MRKFYFAGSILLGISLLALAVLPASAQRGPQIGRGPTAQGDLPLGPPDGILPPDGLQPLVEEEIPTDLTAEELAAWCIEQATAIADENVANIQDTADQAVGIIDVLLNNGTEEQVFAVARWSIHNVNDNARRSGRQIHRLCARCTRLIYRAGGSNELIDEMWTACREQVEVVLDARVTAVEQIVTASGLPEDQVEEEEVPPPPPAQ